MRLCSVTLAVLITCSFGILVFSFKPSGKRICARQNDCRRLAISTGSFHSGRLLFAVVSWFALGVLGQYGTSVPSVAGAGD